MIDKNNNNSILTDGHQHLPISLKASLLMVDSLSPAADCICWCIIFITRLSLVSTSWTRGEERRSWRTMGDKRTGSEGRAHTTDLGIVTARVQKMGHSSEEILSYVCVCLCVGQLWLQLYSLTATQHLERSASWYNDLQLLHLSTCRRRPRYQCVCLCSKLVVLLSLWLSSKKR